MKDNHIKRVVDSYDQETDDYSAAAGGESSAATAQSAVTVVLDSAKEAAADPENVDVNKVEKAVDKAVEAVKDCGNQSWLEKQKQNLKLRLKNMIISLSRWKKKIRKMVEALLVTKLNGYSLRLNNFS